MLNERVKNLNLASGFELSSKNLSDITDQTSKIDVNITNDFTFFYQSVDGQNVYANALNTRCLISQYGSLYQSPLNITAKIVYSESYFMDEENRRKFRYLSHLPLHTEFKLVELELKEPVLSQGTLTIFAQEIDERKKV